VLAGERTEVGLDSVRIVFQLYAAYDTVVRIERRQKARPLVLVDARVIDCFHEVPPVFDGSAILSSDAGAFLEISSARCGLAQLAEAIGTDYFLSGAR
jgi:hypothetical protein